jgi:hypothetical protein
MRRAFAFGRTNFRAVWVGLGLTSMKIARHKKQNPAGECRVCFGYTAYAAKAVNMSLSFVAD